jgi:N-acetylneuraminic acid mutarotase
MRQRLLLGIIATLSISTSCSSGDDLDGNWIARSSYDGRTRSNAVCFVIDDEAYVGTGYDGDDRLGDFRKYDGENDGWSSSIDSGDDDAVATFGGTVRQSAVAFSAGGKGYVGTGFDGDVTRYADFYEYDPDENAWTQIEDIPGGARMEAVAFGIGDCGYVGTGYGFLDGDDKNELKDFWKYDTSTGEWSSLSFSGEKLRGGTAFVIDDIGYVMLGKSNGSTVEDVYSFDPDTETWTAMLDIDDDDVDADEDDILRYYAAAFVIDSKAYIATGTNGSLQRDVWEFDPAGNDGQGGWEEKTSLEDEVSSRSYAVGFSVNNRGYICTGNSSGTRLDDLWEFDPNMDEDDDDN